MIQHNIFYEYLLYNDQLYITSKLKMKTEYELSACTLSLFMLNEYWNVHLEYPKLCGLKSKIRGKRKFCITKMHKSHNTRKLHSSYSIPLWMFVLSKPMVLIFHQLMLMRSFFEILIPDMIFYTQLDVISFNAI